ncbi:unnamed protein product [Leptidea sinapis]|uniref:BPTI/Kunitz inhibitor domain-containing protein n=1 Tax=Leptidea sinapis TaxID=189913 RepID=A0A5E4QIJ3_9NEOP|nr:unnamed protein product [Leptidea sinapis]
MEIRIYVNVLELFIFFVTNGYCVYQSDVRSTSTVSVRLVTLTTASIRQSTSPKPSTIFRRINIDRSIYYNRSTDMELLQLGDTRRRNSRRRSQNSEIWNWEKWCLLQKQKGKCDEKLKRYYYDVRLGVCLSFDYSGCDQNKNNFESKQKCERFCKGIRHSTNLEMDRELKCTLQPDIGKCLGFQERYYYDLNKDYCRKFIYGGCGTGINSFKTKYNCMKTCSNERV